jgi:kinesin family protein 3/17
MEGEVTSEKDKGIILHAFDHIFAYISKIKNKTFLVRASFLQIYMEDVFDLLGDPTKKLHVRIVGGDTSVIGLSSHIVKNPEEITALLLRGKANRATGETLMNPNSSRSHSVFTVIIEQQEADGRCRMGKLNLVDLAGSERLGKTGAGDQRAKEGAKINQSLLCLGNVISALVTGSKHIAYRDSKLTQLLQDSLGGNSKTVMCATIGPASYNYEETLSTLVYATRARDIKNAPRINEDPKDALLSQLVAQIEALKHQLATQNASLVGGGIIVGNDEFLRQIAEQHQQQIEALMAEKNMNEELRQQTRERLDREYEHEKQTKEESEKLRSRIEQMEKSVLVGGVNLVDKAKQQEEELRAKESDLRRQQEERKQLAKQGEQEQEQILMAEKKYGSLKEEASQKAHQIKKVRQLTASMEEGIEDSMAQFTREKAEQTAVIQSLKRELMLLKLIGENFIPDDQIALIEEHCHYDQANRSWRVENVELAGCHRKCEEELPVESVFIPGIEGAIFAPPVEREDEEAEKKRAEATRKKKVAVDRAMNTFALPDTLARKK